MKLLWLDLETTGLDPNEDEILEIAVYEADHMTPFDVRPLYHAVLALHPARPMNELVFDMHTRNGLREECYRSEVSVSSVQVALLNLVPAETDRKLLPVLAGSSIHFDLGFLRVHTPEFAARLSHRLYDVSAVKLFCESIGMPPLPKAEAHRSQADVLESIDHAQRCAAWVRPVPFSLPWNK
jgi:oligoribonuclease